MFKVNQHASKSFGEFSIAVLPTILGGIIVSVVKTEDQGPKTELIEIFNLHLSFEIVMKLLTKSE